MGTYTFTVKKPDGTLSVTTVTVLDLENVALNLKKRGAEIQKIIEKPFDLEEFRRKFIF